jgi:hypothetical protein
MSSPHELANFSKRILTMQIIAAALALGAFFFLVIVLVVRSTGHAAQPPATPLLTYIGIGFAVMALAASMFVPQLIVAGGLKNIVRRKGSTTAEDEIVSLCFLYQTSMIQGLALIEGAAFFQIIAYLIEGQAASLIAAAILLVLMVLQIPHRARVEAWIERQQVKMQEQSGFGNS